MNEKKRYTRINFLKQNIKFNSLCGSKENMFQYCKNNSEEHELKKFEVFQNLIKNNYSVFTEVEFKQGGRADVIAFAENGDGFIFEIVKSESEKSKINKINNYPIDFELVFVEVNKPLEVLA